VPGHKQKRAPRQGTLFPTFTFLKSRSEVEFDRELYDTVALLVRGSAEQRSVHRTCAAIEAERQVLPAIEGPQRMVQEVISVDTELQLPGFAELEVLEQPRSS